MRIFGIDPGSVRTGFGCIETDGSRSRLVTCGAITLPARASFPDKLLRIHARLAELLGAYRPDCVVVESLFYAVNARSALQLGHARGVALLAARQAGLPLVEYTPAQVKQTVTGYGRAEKIQVQEMVRVLLGLRARPSPLDAADALAVALCHVHHQSAATSMVTARPRRGASWRHFRPGSTNLP
ncbi:MAG: crossover junction endodeoxyribonuclease RuvC [Luteitalea sp.]|nr:crossover junction endodeoxyribonuclease RuvC [Luteitalea sp.]